MRVPETPSVGSIAVRLGTMFTENPNDNEGNGVSISQATDQIEGAILSVLWQRTDECPACGNTAPLRIGRVETHEDGREAESSCELCDLLLQHTLD